MTYALAHHELSLLESDKGVDFAISVPTLARLRANFYKQGSLPAVLRMGMSGAEGMGFMDNRLCELLSNGKGTVEMVLQYAFRLELVEKRLHMKLRK